MREDINWFGLVGGATIVCLIVVSFFVPWWELSVGDGLVKANVSPLYTNFNFVGYWFTIPLLWALNLGTILTMAAGGVAMLIYSLYPTKSYSEQLMGFGYRKPLFSVLLFVGVLIVLTQTINALFGLNVPLVGSATSILPESMTYGTVVTVLISAGFQWPFYLAMTAAVLCIVGKFYHKKLFPTSPLAATASAKNKEAVPAAEE